VRKDVIERFKDEELPKILIVTDMLLTGFDAPILQTMYLDKPLKEHRLLQAIARTNRPYGDAKEAGLIIDYVGILRQFKRALEMYHEADVTGALFDYETLKNEFVELVKEIMEIFGGLERDFERTTLLKGIEILTTDEEKERAFVEKYRNLRKVFELLGPDEVKLEYFDDYKWLSAIFVYYMKVAIQRPAYDAYVQKYFEKTVKFVHKSTEVDKLEKELPVIAFDEEYLQRLGEKVKDKKEQAANILFALNRLVLVDRHRSPVYESLVERVERLLELWKEKTKDYEQIYKQGVMILDSADALSERQRKLGFSDLQYSILLVLEERLGEKDKLAEKVRGLTQVLEERMFAGWISQTTARKEVEREVRRFVRGLKSEYGFSLDEMNMLYQQLVESVSNYGA
jgi:type I restriction enzyme R subunit